GNEAINKHTIARMTVTSLTFIVSPNQPPKGFNMLDEIIIRKTIRNCMIFHLLICMLIIIPF
ncbi:hypothetical protein KEL61_04020, partial [Enterococcus faecium]|nr:hypothetical protein [Enterococcus faecium]